MILTWKKTDFDKINNDQLNNAVYTYEWVVPTIFMGGEHHELFNLHNIQHHVSLG